MQVGIAKALSVIAAHWNGELPVNLSRICEKVGVQVSYDMNFPGAGVARIDRQNGQVRIVLNRRHPALRLRWALAHALGAVLCESSDTLFDVSDYSTQAATQENLFAAELLMPRTAMDLVIMQARSIEGISKLLNVSEVAVASRLRALKITC